MILYRVLFNSGLRAKFKSNIWKHVLRGWGDKRVVTILLDPDCTE